MENCFICNARAKGRRIENLALLDAAITPIEQPASSSDTTWQAQTKHHHWSRSNPSSRNTSTSMVKKQNANEYITSILVKISGIAMIRHLVKQRTVFTLARSDTKMIFDIFWLLFSDWVCSILSRSDPAWIILGEWLMPKYLRSLAHVIVITQGLAILCYSVLNAVLEVLGLLIAGRLKHALQKYIFILLAGGFMLGSRRSDQGINWLEYPLQPSVKSLMNVSHA